MQGKKCSSRNTAKEIMENNTFEEIWNKLKNSEKVLMSLHYGPDGDSLGACTAMKYVLERDFQTKVKLVSYDAIAENLKSIDFSKEVDFGTDISEENSEEYDLYLSLDASTPDWLSSKAKENFRFPKNKTVINIDHHENNSYFGNFNYVNPGSSSTCAILVDLFKDRNVKFDKKLATRALLGVCTDSGFFTYKENLKGALEKANFLIKHGADYYDKIVKPVLLSQPLRIKQLNAYIVSNLKINNKLNCAYASIPKEFIKNHGLNKAEARLGILEIQQIAGFDFVFTLTEMDDDIKGSLRSARGEVDVSKLAEALEGRGHKEAAGFFLQKMPLEDAEALVLKTIEKIGIHKSTNTS